jgi:hypothetical protein
MRSISRPVKVKPNAGTIGVVLIAVVFLLSPQPSADTQADVGRDANFVAYANGVVADTQTGLEWVAGPDKDTSYHQAAAWVRSLTIAGGGWRMPTERELRTLCRVPGNLSTITPLLPTTGIHIWPYQEDEDLALYGFRYMDPYGTRGFAVRSAPGGHRIDPAKSRK